MYIVSAAPLHAAAWILTFLIYSCLLPPMMDSRYGGQYTKILQAQRIVVSYNKISISLFKWQLGRAVMVSDGDDVFYY